GSEGIAQLMGKCCEKLIFSSIGLAQGLFHLPTVRNIGDHADDADNAGRMVEMGSVGGMDPAGATSCVLGFGLDLGCFAGERIANARFDVLPGRLANHLADSSPEDLVTS